MEKNYKISGAVDNQGQMEPAVKKEIYNASRLGLSTIHGGGGEPRDFQRRGTNHTKQDKEYAKQLFFKLQNVTKIPDINISNNRWQIFSV